MIEAHKLKSICGCDLITYLFQGGGALGSYQVGIYSKLSNAGYEPNWLVGTSIGAINAAIIAGNPPEKRIQKLHEFWDLISRPVMASPVVNENIVLRRCQNHWSAQATLLNGQPGFFSPRIFENPSITLNHSPDQISYYDISELTPTLEKLIDFDLINKKHVRLTTYAIEIESGQSVQFDNTKHLFTVKHILASCALPPGFPAVEIDGKYYWDGGMSANTPLSVFLEDSLGKNCLCFSMQLFDSYGLLPKTLDDVLKRKKDITFASQYRRIINSYKKIYNFRHAIHQLHAELPVDKQKQAKFKSLSKLGIPTQLNLVRFHYRGKPTDLSSKDYDFSSQSINDHLENGYEDAEQALQKTPWLKPIPANEGIMVSEISEIEIPET